MAASVNLEDIPDGIRALVWRCRRGMKEVETLLTPFLFCHYLQLSTEDQELFKELLAQPDPDLFNWLMGSEAPPKSFEVLIQRIQKNV